MISGNTHAKRRRRPDPATHEAFAQRRFVANAPNRLWRADLTEYLTATSKIYFCPGSGAVLDVFSRTIVGWSIADHMRSDLVVDALQMATWRRRP